MKNIILGMLTLVLLSACTSTHIDEPKKVTVPIRSMQKKVVKKEKMRGIKIKNWDESFNQVYKNKKVKEMRLSFEHKEYSENDDISFSLDTDRYEGYLTVFYIDEKQKPTLLYPNPDIKVTKIAGKHQFPEDFSPLSRLKAKKNSKSSEKEKATIYTLLSARPIKSISAIVNKDGFLNYLENLSIKAKSRGITLEESTSIEQNRPTLILDTNHEFKMQLGRYEFFIK